MKVFLILVVTLNICSCGFAEKEILDLAHPDYPGKCVYMDLVLSPGQNVTTPYRCALLECGAEGKGTIHVCPARHLAPGCIYDGHVDFEADFPLCCEIRTICD